MTGDSTSKDSRLRNGKRVGAIYAVVCAVIGFYAARSGLGSGSNGNAPLTAFLYPWELFSHYIFQVNSYFVLFTVVPIAFLCFHFSIGFGVGYLCRTAFRSTLFIVVINAAYFSVSGYKLCTYPQRFKTVHIGDSKEAVIEKMGEPERYETVLLSGQKAEMLYGRSMPPMWWTVDLDSAERVVGVGFRNMNR